MYLETCFDLLELSCQRIILAASHFSVELELLLELNWFLNVFGGGENFFIMLIFVFWFQLYKIRRGKTRPQALLFLCMILLLIVLHTSYMIYSLAPQYVMYGSQKYLVQVRCDTCFKKKTKQTNKQKNHQKT